jgi:CheY-like chemotaxis protein
VQPIRVLLANPDPGAMYACRDHLVGEGFAVATAGDGLECLAQLRAFTPDALVLDMGLLWGGGDGVLARLRDGHDLPQVPLVLVSRQGHAGPAAPGWPLAACPDSPWAPPALARTIREWLHLCPPSPPCHVVGL